MSKTKRVDKTRNGKFRKMCIWVVIVILCCSVFAACSPFFGNGGSTALAPQKSNHSVPNQLVLQDIQDKFRGRDVIFSDIEHEFDDDTYIDTVKTVVMEREEYYTDYLTATAMYRYNKSNDTWDLYKDFKYSDKRREYKSTAFIGHWEGYFKNTGRYDVNISAVDFDKNTITGSFRVSAYDYYGAGDVDLFVEGEYKMEAGSYYSVSIEESGYTLTFKLDEYGFHGVRFE